MEWKSEVVKKYPELFREGGDQYFAVGDGWQMLLEALFEAMMRPVLEARRARKLAEKYLGTADFWTEERVRLCQIAEDQALKALPIVLQVKEKFGGLRVYLDREDPAADMAIEMATLLALNTCETCGKMGPDVVLSAPKGWFRVRCVAHAESAIDEPSVG